MRALAAVVAGMMLLSSPSRAEVDEALRQANLDAVRQRHEQLLAAHAGNPDTMVRPGLIADRAARTITVEGEATGILAGEPVEFFLIGLESGHAYESLAVSFAAPGDIQKALLFIGMEPGRGVDSEKLQFWPMGERVHVTVSSLQSNSPIQKVRIESLILDQQTGTTLPEHGLVFTGSPTVTNDAGAGLAADLREPNSVGSTYNEPDTVLDVPRSAPQGDVYQNQSINPARIMAPGERLRFMITPERAPGTPPRVQRLTLTVSPSAANTSSNHLGDLVFSVTHPSDGTAVGGDLNAALKHFTECVDAGHDPFVTLVLDGGVPLSAAQQTCQILGSIENPKGIRIEPPGPGQLYYRAFNSDERFRDRESRTMQPWELWIHRSTDGLTAKLIQVEEKWRDDRVQPDLTPHEYPLPRPEALREALDRLGPGMPVILVFADAGTTFGELMDYLQPVLDTHPIIHVYTHKP